MGYYFVTSRSPVTLSRSKIQINLFNDFRMGNNVQLVVVRGTHHSQMKLCTGPATRLHT